MLSIFALLTAHDSLHISYNKYQVVSDNNNIDIQYTSVIQLTLALTCRFAVFQCFQNLIQLGQVHFTSTLIAPLPQNCLQLASVVITLSSLVQSVSTKAQFSTNAEPVLTDIRECGELCEYLTLFDS